MEQVLTPHLYFAGNARQVLDYYQDILQAESLGIMTYGDLLSQGDMVSLEDVANGYQEEDKELVAHAEISILGGTIYLEDLLTVNHEEVIIGNNLALTLTLNNDTTFDRYFAGLRLNGEVIESAETTSWAKKYAVVIDKFGVKWILNLVTE